MVDRIAVHVTFGGISKFLGAPKIQNSTGASIADVVYNQLIKWNICRSVKAMGFDTTSSNSGDKSGACVLLCQRLNSNLLSLPCRHHIYEIILKSVFDVKMSASSGPGVPLFERFSKAWSTLEHSSYKSGFQDDIVRAKISDNECDDLKCYCQNLLHESLPRSDYKEFLQLALIFLGEENLKFRVPGAISHARWMAKAIYCLKIFVFRDQFAVTRRELSGLRDICIFLVKIYIKSWFGCTNAIKAPNQDIVFLKKAVDYSDIDSTISNAIINKLKNHVWYLAEETIALAFFDSDVCLEEKKKMVMSLSSKEPSLKLNKNRSLARPEEIVNYDISDFVSERTLNFFVRFELSSSFVHSDPATWESNENYQNGQSFCKTLAVVNDVAERGVKFMKDFNKILTNDEDEKQILLQIVEAYRKKYPSYKKSELL